MPKSSSMPSLFTAAPALVPCRQRPLPAVVVTPALILSPSAPALACCRRPLDLVPCPSKSALNCRLSRAGSHPLAVSIHPHLSSSPPPPPPTEADGDNLSPRRRRSEPSPSRRRPRPRRPVNLRPWRPLPVSIRPRLPSSPPPPPPPPTVVNVPGRSSIVAVRRHPRRPATALAVPSTSVLRSWRPLPVSVHPRLPSSPPPPPPMAADAPGRSPPSAATLDVPPPPSPSRQPPYCGHGVPCPSASAVRPRLPPLPPPPPPTEVDAPGTLSPSTAALAVPSTSYCGHGVPIFLPLFKLELETLAEESIQRKEKAEKVYF